jgi:hypothetical protein
LADEEPKKRILARRAQFMAAAVASLSAASACDRCGESPKPVSCLSVSVLVPDAGATIEDDAAPPRPCLEIMDTPLDAGRPHPCLSVIMPPPARDAGATLEDAGRGTVTARPCLKMPMPNDP